MKKSLIILLLLIVSFITNCGSGGSGGSGGPMGDSNPSYNNTNVGSTVPSVPTGVLLTSGNGKVTIRWDHVPNATSYNLYWSLNPGVSKVSGNLIAGITSPYVHAPLNNGTTYYYVVTSMNVFGESIESIQVSGTPVPATSNLPPSASFSGPNSALIGDDTTFDASISNDTDGFISTFTFDFGDGSPSITQSTPIFTHTYTQYGSFKVTLTVIDNKGASNSATGEISIGLVFTNPVNISQTSTYSQTPKLTIDEKGNIYVVWEEDGGDILFASSLDGGKTFSAPKSIMPRSIGFDSEQMRVTTANGDVHVTWTLFSSDGWADVLYSRLKAGENTFSDPIVISDIDWVNSYVPSIATSSSNNVSIVWADADVFGIGADSGILYSYSPDGGNNFSYPQMISNNGGLCPDVASVSGKIYLMWSEGEEIFFSQSTDGGLTFSAGLNISQVPDKSWCPHIRVDSSGNIYAVWEEGTAFSNRKILFSKSTNSGLSFDSPLTLSSSTEDSFCPSVAVSDNGQVYVTWSSGDPLMKTGKSFLAFSSNRGVNFSIPLKIPVISEEEWCPQILVRHVNQIGITWNGPLRLPGNAYISPDIFYSNGQISIP